MTLATRKASLETRLDAIATELAAMSATKAGGLPSASGPGVRVDHVEYRLSLLQEQRELMAAIITIDAQAPEVIETIYEG